MHTINFENFIFEKKSRLDFLLFFCHLLQGDSIDENGDPCPRLCTIKCPEEQIKCGQPKTDTGCLQNDICVHKGFDDNSNLCDGFCPVQCEDFELLCSGPNTLEGCKTPPKCIPKR